MRPFKVLLSLLIPALAVSGCGDPSAGCPFCRDEQEVVLADADLMAVRVRWSALNEAASVIDPSTVCEETPSDALFRRNIRANSCVWVPQCRIFLGQIAVPDDYGFFADDTAVGDPGDVVIAQGQGGSFGLSPEMITLGEMAHDHWSEQPGGILAIAINKFILANGSAIGVRGYGLPPTNTQRPLVYVVDPAFIPGGVDSEHIFAHEVGHSLGLCHTDECDQLGGESPLLNLMTPPGAANSTRLVASQCITARTTYPSLFEAPAAPQISPGLRVSRRLAPDSLLGAIQLQSEVSEETGLSLFFRTREPLAGKEASFWVSVDLDGDPATGLDSRGTVPEGRQQGTDLIVRVATDADGSVAEGELFGASGLSFAPITLGPDDLRLNSQTVEAHVVTDAGCSSHPAFNEISVEIAPTVFTELGHKKPSSAQDLERVGLEATARIYSADGQERVEAAPVNGTR